MVNNELYHYGVLGMRWGVRRFQRKDGTLTAAGKKRAAGNDDDQSTEQTTKTATKGSSSSAKKTVREMSDEELILGINRMTLERRYTELAKQSAPPAKSSAGKAYALKILSRIGEQSLVEVGSKVATELMGKMVNKAFDAKVVDTKSWKGGKDNDLSDKMQKMINDAVNKAVKQTTASTDNKPKEDKK